MKKILFIDRDGTIIEEPKIDKQVDSLEKLKFLNFAISSLKKLQNAGFEMIMISNQDWRWTKHFPEKDFLKPQNKMLEILKSEWIYFNDIFICPHFEKENCNCRKPKTKLLEDYLSKNKMDKNNSFVIWDRETDLFLAKNLWIKWVLIENNWQKITKNILSRKAKFERKTNETNIKISLNLDWEWVYKIDTGLKFFDHMLEQISKHSWIDLDLFCKWDLEIDEHHTVEDVWISLWKAIWDAIWNKKWITRYWFLLPMDESLAQCAIDLSGRAQLVFDWKFEREFVWDFPTEMVKHFFKSFSDGLLCNLNMKISWENEHHKIEALFKSLAKCLKQAVKIEGNQIPSSKWIL